MSGRIPYDEYRRLSRASQRALTAAVRANESSGRGRSVRRAAPKLQRARSAAPRVPRVPRSFAARALDAAEAVLPVAMAGLKLAGFGDYAMSPIMPESNSLMAAITANGPPALQSTSRREHVVRHREYIGDVITGGTSAFNVSNYPINPGVAQTFPWLSAIAQNFEQYRVDGMVFEFKSTSADALNSTNTALGTVIMATEYNSDSDPFANKQQMENHEFASSARQSCSMLHPVECKKSLTAISELYVRSETPPDGQDLRLYDLGRFSIATVGQQGASVNIGELWVTYEITLLKPQIPDTPAGVQGCHYAWSTGASTSDYFASGTTLEANYDTTSGFEFSTTTITFPPEVQSGDWIVKVYWQGASTAVQVPTPVATNCTSLQNMSKYLSTYESNSGSTSTSLSLTQVYRVTKSRATIQMTVGTLPGTGTNGDIIISLLPTDPGV